MIENLLGVLYVLSFLAALFCIYVYMSATGAIPLRKWGASDHIKAVAMAMYWPLTMIVFLAYLAWRGLLAAAEQTGPKMDNWLNEAKRAWNVR